MAAVTEYTGEQQMNGLIYRKNYVANFYLKPSYRSTITNFLSPCRWHGPGYEMQRQAAP